MAVILHIVDDDEECNVLSIPQGLSGWHPVILRSAPPVTECATTVVAKKSLQSEKQQVSGQPNFFFNNYAKSGRNHLQLSVRPGTSIVHA